MITRLGYRGLHLFLVFFAALGFFSVRLGKKTGFEHATAVFTTPAARNAIEELYGAGVRLRAQLTEAAAETLRRFSSDSDAEPSSEPPTLNLIEVKDAGADVSVGDTRS